MDRKKWIIIISIIAVIVLLVGGYFGYHFYKKNQEETNNSSEGQNQKRGEITQEVSLFKQKIYDVELDTKILIEDGSLKLNMGAEDVYHPTKIDGIEGKVKSFYYINYCKNGDFFPVIALTEDNQAYYGDFSFVEEVSETDGTKVRNVVYDTFTEITSKEKIVNVLIKTSKGKVNTCQNSNVFVLKLANGEERVLETYWTEGKEKSNHPRPVLGALYNEKY